VVSDADRQAVTAMLAALSELMQADVMAVFTAKLAIGASPIRDVPSYIMGLARNARAGTLTLPSNIQTERQTSKIETQKSAVLAAVADGDAIFLDGNPAEIELDKFARTATCTVPLAAALSDGRITTQPKKELQNENS